MRTFDLIIWLKWALSGLHLQRADKGKSVLVQHYDVKAINEKISRSVAFRLD
jgi:hypothetical protein